MSFYFSVQFRFGKEAESDPSGPEGSESMVIHQEQPRYAGFRQETRETLDAS